MWCVCVWGGGYSHFFFIRRIGSSMYRVPPKKNGNIKHPPKNIHKSFLPPKLSIFLTPSPHKNYVIQKFKQKNAPSLRMYQTVSEYLHHPPPPPPPSPLRGPWSLCGCNLAMECQQIYQNAKIFSSTRPDAWSYLKFVPFSRSEILETIPTILKSSWLVTHVSNRRELVYTMKVILTVRGASW